MRNDKRSLSPSPRKLDLLKLQRTKGTTNNTNITSTRNTRSTSIGRSNVSSARKRATSLNTKSISTPSRSASKPRLHKNNLKDVVNDVAASISYQRNWSQVILGSTSGLLFVMSIGLMYSMYMLCQPYGDSISFGILLSVILHPKTREHSSNSRAAREDCVRQMRSVHQMWAERSKLFGVIGSLISLKYFFSYALLQTAIYLGLNKLLVRSWWAGKQNKGVEKQNVKGEKFFLVSTPRGRMLLRLIATSVLSLLAHFMIGFSFFLLMHLVLFIIFAVTIVFVSEDYFIEFMWRLWRIAVITFFIIGLSYNFALDIISISGAVKRTTSAVVSAQHQWTNGGSLWEDTMKEGESKQYINNNNNISTNGTVVTSANTTSSYLSEVQEMILSEVQQRVLNELAECMNYTNATELAVNVRQALTPMLSTFPSKITMGVVINKSVEMYTSLFSSNSTGASLRKVDWVGVATSLLERWRPFFVYATRVIFLLSSNVVGFFDSIYAFVLFIFVLQYFLQLEHTILYYVVAKMFKALHPEFGERHARNIERDITVSLLTLLQSFWHLLWFHFCITFCLFQRWSFPTPFFSGLLSALTAIFPLLPAWFSPISFALVYSMMSAFNHQGLLGVLVDLRVWCCAAAFLLSHMDEWLLCVSRGLRGSSVRDAAGVVREELPTFVIGTALLLGYVSYGVRGILFGPIIAIVAKVFFDNWGTVPVRETIASSS